MSHIGQNHDKVVLGSSQQVGAENDRQCFSRHVIVFFKVCDSLNGRLSSSERLTTKRELTYQGALKLVSEDQSLLGEVLEQHFECWRGDRQGFQALLRTR